MANWKYIQMKVFIGGFLLVVLLVATAKPSMAQTTTETLQACQNHDWQSCMQSLKSVMSSYPAPGMTTLINEMGDRMNSILSPSNPVPSASDNGSAGTTNNDDGAASNGSGSDTGN